RSRIRRAGAELAEQVDRRPPATGPADPFALTTDFADLLAGRDPS
ncbi:NADPH-dependent FMN reductase, partial [Xanthomonas citri pv. citri]|nr:NADPH-dependent FMN reductase [Xanthomonas citri pv. citri]